MQGKIPVWIVKATLSKVSRTALMACFLRLFAWTDTFLRCWDRWWRCFVCYWQGFIDKNLVNKTLCDRFVWWWPEKAQLYQVFQRIWLPQCYKSSTSLYQCVLHRSVSSLLIILLEFLHTYPNFSELFLKGSEMEALRTGTRPGVWLVQIIVLLLLSFIWKLTQLLLIWNVQLPILLFTENKHLEIIFNVYSYLWFFNKPD